MGSTTAFGERQSPLQRVLLIAPHPFFQERGTPIATRLLLEALAARGAVVDVVTYHEGKSVVMPGITIHRIPAVWGTRNIWPGWSFKKLVCDIFLFGKALRLMWKRERYHVLYGIEEGAFIALTLGVLFRVAYVYDMDSSMVQQMVARFPMLNGVRSLLDGCIRLVVRRAEVVVPMCDALAAEIAAYHPQRVEVLQDISLIQTNGVNGVASWRQELGLTGAVVLYVGNFVRYQGIDLLLESFARVAERKHSAHLVLIGGSRAHLAHYGCRASEFGIENRVHFLGPRPVDRLGDYLTGADILVSPRIEGANTPMKIYSYMDSATPIVATDLPTHTQVLDDQVAVLAAPQSEAFADALCLLIDDAPMRRRLGLAAQKRANENHNPEVFARSVDRIFDALPPLQESKVR